MYQTPSLKENRIWPQLTHFAPIYHPPTDSSMDKNIKYVREKRIALLLNDMVVHLLNTHPEEPLGALIDFLERKYPEDIAEGEPESKQADVKEDDPDSAEGMKQEDDEHPPSRQQRHPVAKPPHIQPTGAEENQLRSALHQIVLSEREQQSKGSLDEESALLSTLVVQNLLLLEPEGGKSIEGEAPTPLLAATESLIAYHNSRVSDSLKLEDDIESETLVRSLKALQQASDPTVNVWKECFDLQLSSLQTEGASDESIEGILSEIAANEVDILKTLAAGRDGEPATVQAVRNGASLLKELELIQRQNAAVSGSDHAASEETERMPSLTKEIDDILEELLTAETEMHSMLSGLRNEREPNRVDAARHGSKELIELATTASRLHDQILNRTDDRHGASPLPKVTAPPIPSSDELAVKYLTGVSALKLCRQVSPKDTRWGAIATLHEILLMDAVSSVAPSRVTIILQMISNLLVFAQRRLNDGALTRLLSIKVSIIEKLVNG